MGKRGPKATPTKLKELRGNPGKRPLPVDEPEPVAEVPMVPRGMKTHHKLAVTFWEEHGEAMAGLGVLTAADAGAWRLMAHHYEMALLALKQVEREGLTRRDEAGVERKHPALQIWRDNSRLFLKYAAEFGLTPSGRVGLKVEPRKAKAQSIADELFRMVNGKVDDE
jgi:P27 family predicted phage terminase small subunit